MMPIRASIVGPPCSATRIRASIGGLPFRRVMRGLGKLSDVLAGITQRDLLAAVRFPLSALNRNAGYDFASNTDQLDPGITIKLKLLSFRTLSQVSLGLHEAGGRAAKLSRHPYDRARIVARAVIGMRRNRSGAYEDEGGKHSLVRKSLVMVKYTSVVTSKRDRTIVLHVFPGTQDLRETHLS
ncbi:hypothetical protein [Bradyrhizobium sp. UFLA05-109]